MKKKNFPIIKSQQTRKDNQKGKTTTKPKGKLSSKVVINHKASHDLRSQKRQKEDKGTTKRRNKIICLRCRKSGHVVKDCWSTDPSGRGGVGDKQLLLSPSRRKQTKGKMWMFLRLLLLLPFLPPITASKSVAVVIATTSVQLVHRKRRNTGECASTAATSDIPSGSAPSQRRRMADFPTHAVSFVVKSAT